MKATAFGATPNQTVSRWEPSQSSSPVVVFTGLTLANGATVSAPLKATLLGIVLGDSITECYGCLNESAANDVLRSDATRGWAYDLRRELGAEIGVVGFGGQGWDSGGQGAVPAFPSTWNYLYSGVSRSFAGLDFVVINMGTNGTTTVSNVTTVLNGLILAVPASCKIFVLRPFNGVAAANLQAGIAATTSPSRITYIDTTGAVATNSDALHSTANDNLITNGPLVASQLRAAGLGASTTTVTKPPFLLAFH